MYIYIQNKANVYPFVDYSTFTVDENNLSGYYNCNSAMEKENSWINGPNHGKKIQLLIDYQCTLLKSILFNSSILDQYEIKLI